MIGRTNAGGAGKAFAAISVTYPAGSTCTCTKGYRTLRAKNTSGSALFFVPEAGDWAIKITDGSRTVSKTYNINRETMVHEVFISYWDGYIFNAASGGDQTAITGGWEKIGTSTAPTLTVNASRISLLAGGSGGTRRSATTVNPIDLTGYSTLRVTGYCSNTGSNYYFALTLAKANGDESFVIKKQFTTSSTTHSVDISQLDKNKKYYLQIGNASNVNASIITSAYLV